MSGYRYTLTRDTGLRVSASTALWIMLNPSTAGDVDDDPTIRRVVRFSRDWGHRHVAVVNLYAVRATDPDDLWRHDDPVGRDNDREILRALSRLTAARSRHASCACLSRSDVICAWGTHARPERARAVYDLLRRYLPTCDPPIRIGALAVNRDGSPRHPLYVRADTRLVEYEGPPS